ETNQNGDDASPIAEGVQVRVSGAPNDAKDFLHVANASGPINPATYAAWGCGFNGWCFPDATGQDAPSTDWGGGMWGIHTGGSGGGDESYAGRFVPRVFRNDNFTRFVPYDFELRFTAGGGKAYLAFTTGAVIDVPFELWNIGVNTPNDPSDDYRMIPWLNDADGNGAFNLQKVDHGVSGGDNDPYTDWIYWFNPADKSPGQNGYTTEFVNLGAAYDTDPNSGANTGAHQEVMARVVLVNFNGGSVSDPSWPANANSVMPATGNVIRILATKPNTPAVVFNYSTASYAASKSAELEKTSAARIGVFPNPYYAFNPAETNRFVRFVTFNNLPPVAKVRIFNLAGQLVRTLDKNDNSQFLRWDLNNGFFLAVASGIYIAYIEATLSDGSVVTKIVKLAIIQEQEVPDVF
ncbi:MAG: T9SS type A sorting domain-containing protein, partial [Ignavibacteriales bacterium]|nr:T9SS type A sorting domain-containing protein [Ignavibacteriales bacterium]